MACMKLGLKSDAVQKQGEAWFCTSGLPSDVVVEVGEMLFHLHKFPLLSRSGVIKRLVAEESCVVKLPNFPGGANAFETVAKFCYGVKPELTSANFLRLLCAADHLEMTEDYGEGNLVSQTENFLNQVVLESWRDSLQALHSCDDTANDNDYDILPYAEKLGIIDRLIDSLASKAFNEQNLLGWPVMESPGGSVLWNGISTGFRASSCSSDWWFDDVSILSIPLYKRLVLAMESHGVKNETIVGSIYAYAKNYLPGLNGRQTTSRNRVLPIGSISSLSEKEQKVLVEEIDQLLPFEKGLIPTKFLFGLLKTGRILGASPSCISNLEKRIGMQLDEAALDDLLMPTCDYSMETLYDVECVSRIVDHFLAVDRVYTREGEFIDSDSLQPIMMVAKLIDGYLAEVAPDVNLKLSEFESLAAKIPDYARSLDDGIYRAIDIYLKSHPLLGESEREQLCRLIDCRKLSFEACTHAAENERLPLRTIIQILFFEQLQLRASVDSCLLVSDNLDGSRKATSEKIAMNAGVFEAKAIGVYVEDMKIRVSELEKECSSLRREVESVGRGKGSSIWGNVAKKLGFQICCAQEGGVSAHYDRVRDRDRDRGEKSREKLRKEKKRPTFDV